MQRCWLSTRQLKGQRGCAGGQTQLQRPGERQATTVRTRSSRQTRRPQRYAPLQSRVHQLVMLPSQRGASQSGSVAAGLGNWELRAPLVTGAWLGKLGWVPAVGSDFRQTTTKGTSSTSCGCVPAQLGSLEAKQPMPRAIECNQGLHEGDTGRNENQRR